MSTDSPVYSVHLEPLEPLLFGDNRAARAGVDHVLVDADPSPLTIHGAVGRFLIDASPEWPERLLGPRQDDMLRPEGDVAQLLGYCLEGPGGAVSLPKPRHLRCRLDIRGEVEPVDLLRPKQTSGYSSASGTWWLDGPLLEDELEGPLRVDEDALENVLTGEVPDGGVTRHEDELYRPEHRPGIAVDNATGLVREAHYFTRPYRRFAPAPGPGSRGAGVRAWFRPRAAFEPLPEPGIGFLGGDRRRARFTFTEAGAGRGAVLDRCRRAVLDAAETRDGGYLLYLLTPSIVVGGEADPPASAVGKARYASGWDVRAGRPRPMTALVPEGSVYFYPWPEDEPRQALVDRLWLSSISPIGAAAGFGRVLVGVFE